MSNMGGCPSSQGMQKWHSHRRLSQIRKMANVNEKWRIQKIACARSKSANVEGGQFAPTRKACKNGIVTADRIIFAKWLTKMKNIAFEKWPVTAVKVPMPRPWVCPNSLGMQKWHFYRRPSKFCKMANENEKACIQKMACARSESANVEGVPFPWKCVPFP